jgi:hypothetical protein
MGWGMGNGIHSLLATGLATVDGAQLAPGGKLGHCRLLACWGWAGLTQQQQQQWANNGRRFTGKQGRRWRRGGEAEENAGERGGASKPAKVSAAGFE